MTSHAPAAADGLPVPGPGIRVVSTDIFDTLLWRRRTSERSRRAIGEQRFAEFLLGHGFTISPEALIEARTQAQRWAFRALDLADGPLREVRLSDVVERQLRILGLPPALADVRMRIEIDIEKRSLSANRILAAGLRRWRSEGRLIVATSDTMLPATMLGELVEHFHGPGLLDRIYSSADHQATKRDGRLFDVVATAEDVAPSAILHMGDDRRADMRMPTRQGLAAAHLPRPKSRHYARLLDGATREVRLRLATTRRGDAPPDWQSAHQFGHDVFGPIVTQFCLRIWLYAAEAERDETCRLLFCARGGIGIREAFERVIERFDLPLSTQRAAFLVSRLVAARAAVVSDSASAFEELGWEFRGDTLREAAIALAAAPMSLPAQWDAPFTAAGFRTLLGSEAGRLVLREIRTQDALFREHLEGVAAGADRLILCDTGLYGSTQRMLSEGLPSMRFETIQFARANYKGHGEEHFPRVAGLVVERRVYDPLESASCVLRYWQLIESLFEPKLPSVRRFRKTGTGSIEAECGPVEYGRIDERIIGEFLRGAISYIEALAPNDGARALADAQVAWSRLRHAIARPRESELRILDVGARSIDFGRSGTSEAISASQAPGLFAKAGAVKRQLWREGAIAHGFPRLQRILLPAFDAAHALRAVRTVWAPARRAARTEGPMPETSGSLRQEVAQPYVEKMQDREVDRGPETGQHD